MKKIEYEMVWRAKWTADGATTLADAAKKLRAAADWLDEVDAAGVVLREPIGDDHAFLITEDPEVAKKYEMWEQEDEDEDESEDE